MNSILNRLEACHVALIAALDREDVAAIEAATGELGDALDTVCAVGAWRHLPEMVDHVQHICALSEAARIRVNFLTDLNQRRIDMFTAARGRPAAIPYGRDGRRTA